MLKMNFNRIGLFAAGLIAAYGCYGAATFVGRAHGAVPTRSIVAPIEKLHTRAFQIRGGALKYSVHLITVSCNGRTQEIAVPAATHAALKIGDPAPVVYIDAAPPFAGCYYFEAGRGVVLPGAFTALIKAIGVIFIALAPVAIGMLMSRRVVRDKPAAI